MYLKLAWRNLWRNKRRTLITAASVFFAVILATFMKSLKEGTYDKMIENVVGVYTGYIQIHQAGYWDEQIIDNSFALDDSIHTILNNHENINGGIPRLECFALTSSKELTKGTMIVGTDPDEENKLTNLKDKVVEGNYFHNGDQAVLLGTGLADFLKLGVNDTLVILGQGYHGATAAAKYPIAGLIKLGSPQLSKSLVYLPLKEAQWLFNAEGRLTSMALQIEDPDKVERNAKKLNEALGAYYEVMPWQEMMPELQQTIEWDTIEGYVFSGILYILIGFGILGTIVMMIAERMHEFGVLVAVGMKRIKLALVLIMEIIIIGILGVLAGLAVVLPLVFWFNLNPIFIGGEMADIYEQFGFEPVLQTSTDPLIFLNQGLIVVILTLFISLYPFFKTISMDALEAMRS